MIDHPDEKRQQDEDFPEDPLLSQSLGLLAKVQVPASFLPNVMYRVYETHHREKIKMPRVALMGLALLLASAAFFAWDVLDYMHLHGLPGFGEALSRKIDIMISQWDRLLSTTAGIFNATWHIITGAGLMLLTRFALQILIIAAIFMGVVLVKKKWLS